MEENCLVMSEETISLRGRGHDPFLSFPPPQYKGIIHESMFLNETSATSLGVQ